MEAIVTQHPIVNWRKKTVKTAHLREKEAKRLREKRYRTVHCSILSHHEMKSHDSKNPLLLGLDPL
jgi:hypothetical protein